MMDILFDAPWWLVTVPVVVGGVVAFTGMRRLEKKVIRGGLAILLVGLLIGLISYSVDTPKERAVDRTHRLVSTAGKRDWQAFSALIDPQTQVYRLKGPAEVTEAAKEIVERFDVQRVGITGTTVTQRDTAINVDIRVYSEQRGVPGASDWRMEYRDMGSGWILYDVRALPNEQMSEERIRSAVERR